MDISTNAEESGHNLDRLVLLYYIHTKVGQNFSHNIDFNDNNRNFHREVRYMFC